MLFFLDTPPWISDKGSSGEFLQSSKIRPYDSPHVFGERVAPGDQPDDPVGFYLPDQTLSSAVRGFRWPSYVDHYCLDWSDSESSHWLLYGAYWTSRKPANFDYAWLLWPSCVDRVRLSCLQRPWQLSVASERHVLNTCKLRPELSL